MEQPDGRLEDANTSISLVSRGSKFSQSHWFSWPVPEAFTPEETSRALRRMEGFVGRRVRFAPDHHQEIFTIENADGPTLKGFLRYSRWRPLAGVTITNTAVIRFEMANFPHLMANLSAKLVPGSAIVATSRSSAGSGEAWFQHFTSQNTRLFHANWVPPRNIFSARDITNGVAQIRELATRGTIHMTAGTPLFVFGVTNDLGEFFQGYLELRSPAGAP